MANFDDSINFRTHSSKKSKTKRILDLINEKRNPHESKKSLSYLETHFIQSYEHDENFFVDLKIWDLEEELETLKEELERVQHEFDRKSSELEYYYDLKKNQELGKYSKPTKEEEIKDNPILRKSFDNLLKTCKQRELYHYEDVPQQLITAKANLFDEVLPEDLDYLLKRELEKNPDLIKNIAS